MELDEKEKSERKKKLRFVLCLTLLGSAESWCDFKCSVGAVA